MELITLENHCQVIIFAFVHLTVQFCNAK
jgi:hypothetical protein